MFPNPKLGASTAECGNLPVHVFWDTFISEMSFILIFSSASSTDFARADAASPNTASTCACMFILSVTSLAVVLGRVASYHHSSKCFNSQTSECCLDGSLLSLVGFVLHATIVGRGVSMQLQIEILWEQPLCELTDYRRDCLPLGVCTYAELVISRSESDGNTITASPNT
jgi:hypothetical protein